MKKAFFITYVIVHAFTAIGQESKTSELYKAILSKDSLLFNVGFNQCDIHQFESLLSDDLKFYHDKDGVSNKEKFLYDLKNGLCKDPSTRQVNRFLIEDSTEVFPLYKNGKLYGAVQNGVHAFSENRESVEGIAKFTHFWQLENNEWKLITAFSFDHKPYENKTPTVFSNANAIDKWLQEKNVPIVGIGVIENGALQQVNVFGLLQNGVSASYNTLFNVASLTKPVTAMVALKLISKGKLSLDEPLYKYWIDADVAKDPRAKKLTTRLVLSHQTGFPNWRWMNADEKLSFQFEPGTQYQYSGEGMEYLRKALEKKFGKSLQDLANELIFEPLNMKDTRYVWNDKINETNYAHAYNKESVAYELVKNKTPNAADDLLTTIEDYGNFLVSVLNKEGLSEKVYNEMITPQVSTTKGKHFGLGFELYDLGNNEIALSHGGSDNGVQTLFILLPKTKNGLVIFTNSDNGTSVYPELIHHYLGASGQKIINIEMN